MSGSRHRFIVEVEPANRGAAQVDLHFDAGGASTLPDEFGTIRRLPSGEWVDLNGVRVRCHLAGQEPQPGDADTMDWTRPELLISTPRGGHVRRLRLALPQDDGSDVLIGRSEKKNDLILDDDHVSRRHIRIVVRQGRYVLEDLGSRWGTFVNGARVDEPMPLGHGDEIIAGKSVMRFIRFSDGFEDVPGSSTSRSQRSMPPGPSWKPDPNSDQGAMTFSATTLLNAPPPREPDRPAAPLDSTPVPREESSTTQEKRRGWMRRKNR